MFRRNKGENKAKLEHKLYLARENPEPTFDLSDCNLRNIPQGVYSLCKVFLKKSLHLEDNCLSSLTGGGQLCDLHLLQILDIHNNAFVYLPDAIYLLKNLSELYANNNQLKKLPETIVHLNNLTILDVSNNMLKKLPDEIGKLTNLKSLNITGNKQLQNLPKSICQCQRINKLQLDIKNFLYPPEDIIMKGTKDIIKYICDDTGYKFNEENNSSNDTNDTESNNSDTTFDTFQEKIRELENIKKQKIQEFLEIEKANELLQKQELELANTQRINREKLLADITEQQSKFDKKLTKLQQVKELERFRLIEQLQEMEQNTDIAIKQLFTLNNEPLAQLLEQEKMEEERLLAAANKYNETLRKNDILQAMQDILQQETIKFQQLNEDRMETSRSILEQEIESDFRLAETLQNQDLHKADLVSKLLEDSELQKAAVGTLLERGDARSWGLVQQVRLVESQLGALTLIEMDRRKLQMDCQLNDLAEKRINLSILLIDLLEQQKERRTHLLSTLQIMEDNSDTADDFWLKQYQRLLDKLPKGLSEAQKNMDPTLAQALLMNGVLNCLPFLAKLTQCQYDVDSITENDLLEAGITNRIDRIHIMDAFRMYKKQQMINSNYYRPTAPQLPIEEASAPPSEECVIGTTECVICMDNECQVIFVPCGHLCCCSNCSVTIIECPLCRADIERKIRVVVP